MEHSSSRDALYADLRAGRIDCNRMIEANQPLVGWKLSDFLDRHPAEHQLRDDLLGAGMLALVEAVHRLRSLREPAANPTAYLATSIDRAFQHVLTDYGTGADNRTCRRHAAQGREILRVGHLPDQLDVPEHGRAVDDLAEAIEALSQDGQDGQDAGDQRLVQLVKLARDGYSVREIARQLGCSLATVYRKRAALEKRATLAGLILPSVHRRKPKGSGPARPAGRRSRPSKPSACVQSIP